MNALSGTADPFSAVTATGLEEPVLAFEFVPVGPVVFPLVLPEELTVTTPFGVTPEDEFDDVAELPEGVEEPEGDGDVAAERT